ncbi:DNA recombination protein RmuC [Leisingera caerulea]|uniref:DNA recombination protein RmuC homolog n=1 Tax=Leisingera caerulea TaxID=506591 RepID=A0A9Q9HKU4_LEICA|nr:DNA recombination protein RmuC [Leisingera caerulea]UWQ54000.1 DNA recombination protein RmuC [Leisingera caerulea]UWQ58592.1 DNA recombination protein RmuC [Leisingera caerulea]
MTLEQAHWAIYALAGLAALLALAGWRSRGHARHLERVNADQRSHIAGLKAEVARLPELTDELATLRRTSENERTARYQAEAQVQALKAEHAARLEELSHMNQQMEHKFASLASGVLKQNSESFLSLVSERFQAHSKTADDDLAKRHAAIESLVKPLDQKLGQFGERIKEIEQARNEAYGAIQAQVKHLAEGQATLGGETRKLVQALRAPKTRGRWGEMQLRQVFEMAGMAEHVDFELEKSVGTDDGLRRPDAVVRIPGGKSIVVDAKTPLEGYLDALEAETPEQQQAALTRHANHVKTHVRQLASKSYQSALGETPDFVVMFIPGETFVSAAAEADPGLIEYAFENKVLIATPTTLMALVKSIAYGWQQEKMAANAVEVQKTAKELYDRLATFSKSLASVGRSLSSSVNNYNKAVGSLEARVLPSARRFEAMGVVANGAELEDPGQVEVEPRQVALLAEE